MSCKVPASQPAQLNSYTESEGARRKGNVPPREQRNWLEVRSAIKSALSLDHVQFPCERTSITLTIHAVIGYNKPKFNCRSIGSLILSTANCYIIIFLLDVNKFVNEKKKARQPLLVFIISRQGQGHDESLCDWESSPLMTHRWQQFHSGIIPLIHHLPPHHSTQPCFVIRNLQDVVFLWFMETSN